MNSQMKALIRKTIRKVKNLFGLNVLYNVNRSNDSKHCLLIYIQHPFYEKTICDAHQNRWQAVELARVIGSFGYQVDVADYREKSVRLMKKYDLVIGLIPRGIDIYSRHLKEKARIIAYLTSSNLEYTNHQEQKRLQELWERRGIRLQARRQTQKIDRVIETFDGALFFGNGYNLRSYDCFRMPPIYYIANNGYDYDFPIEFQKNPKKFLFFGSAGQVHKGLDRLLDIFSEPGFPCELYVCGLIDEEWDFKEAYDRELFHTENIHTAGFVNIHSECFRDLVNQCAFSILPSCAEGQAGSVITMMAAGVIPICSRECGYDDDEVINLPDCEMQTLRETVLHYSGMDPHWIEEKTHWALSVYQRKHTKKHFTDSIRSGLRNILEPRESGEKQADV